MVVDSTRRFSDRVDDCVKARPAYPSEFYAFLLNDLGLPSQFAVADIGSGTGISACPLIEAGHDVYAVEPNGPMRSAAERQLSHFNNFHSVDGTAEQTTLADQSIDLVMAAQAFHWFDAENARREFVRILRPAGWIVLVWNERLLDASPFLRDYESLLLRFNTDYAARRHENVTDERLAEFFSPALMRRREFYNVQHFDVTGLEARLLSSSYTPSADSPQRSPMLAELRQIFSAHQLDGRVTFEYRTSAYFARTTD